jgi:hypothetical protein
MAHLRGHEALGIAFSHTSRGRQSAGTVAVKIAIMGRGQGLPAIAQGRLLLHSLCLGLVGITSLAPHAVVAIVVLANGGGQCSARPS